MRSLYQILKSAKLGAGAAPDLYTAIMAQKMPFAKGSGAEHEYTGAVPVTFTANGQPLLDYLISGNTVQSGTPTPDNPIMPQGTGERTGNLCDYTTVESTTNATATQISGGISVSGRYYVRFRTVEFTVGSTYTMSWKANTISGTSAPTWRFHYADNTYSSMPPSGRALVAEKEVSELLLYVSTAESCIVDFTEIMLNTDSTALPYEPFGVKIPISSTNTTTPVYLGEVETTRKIKKYECTGDESWSVTSAQGRTRAVANFTTSIGIVPLSKVVSTHYIGVEGGAGYPDINTITVNNNGTMIIGISSEYTDANVFKSYLQQQYAAGTPVTVWYVLATEETAVVNEPLMKIGDYADTLSMEQAGVQIPTAKGSTTLDVETMVKPSEIYIKYKE